MLNLVLMLFLDLLQGLRLPDQIQGCECEHLRSEQDGIKSLLGHAAATISLLWPLIGSSLMLIVGWIAGTTWETFPMSVEPMRRSPAGSAVSPNRLKFFAYTASKDGVGTMFSTQFWYGFMLPFCAHCHRGSFHDPLNLRVDVLQSVCCCRSQVELRRRIIRNCVRRLTAVYDDPMDPHIITQVLAKRIDGVVCLDQGIQGIDPFFRCCCRVGRFPQNSISISTQPSVFSVR